MIETVEDAQVAAPFSALALNWLETEPAPLLICTDGLALVWMNAAARAALARGGDLEVKDGAVMTRERAHQAELCDFVKECGPRLSTLALPGRDGDGHLLLRGRRVNAGNGDSAVGLTFLHSGPGFAARHADIDRAYQLTPSEHRILLKMIDGMNAEAIAAAMELSIETVRSHIRHIYIKMGVASREAMFAKIQPFRL
jgi:DNA-binding CsgD family transcriptional regulator